MYLKLMSDMQIDRHRQIAFRQWTVTVLAPDYSGETWSQSSCSYWGVHGVLRLSSSMVGQHLQNGHGRFLRHFFRSNVHHHRSTLEAQLIQSRNNNTKKQQTVQDSAIGIVNSHRYSKNGHGVEWSRTTIFNANCKALKLMWSTQANGCLLSLYLCVSLVILTSVT